MTPRGGYRPLLTCEVWRERDRHLASSGTRPTEEEEEVEEVAEAGTAILSVHFWSPPSNCDQRDDRLLR